MKKILTGILVLLGFYLMAQKPTFVTGTEEGWYQIGETSADFKKERESIIVMGKDEFTFIKLRVHDATINIERLQIYFEGGKVQDVHVNRPLEPGDETREILVDTANKEIDKVVFIYQAIPGRNGEKAKVELYGHKVDGTAEQTEKTGIRNAPKDANDDVLRDAEETREDIREQVRETEDHLENGDEEIDEAGNDMEEVSDNTEEEMSGRASKLQSGVTDPELEDKAGPNGQEIYIDDNNKYYYIDERGNHIYVAPEELRDRAGNK
jgi:hypothetical protein